MVPRKNGGVCLHIQELVDDYVNEHDEVYPKAFAVRFDICGNNTKFIKPIAKFNAERGNTFHVFCENKDIKFDVEAFPQMVNDRIETMRMLEVEFPDLKGPRVKCGHYTLLANALNQIVDNNILEEHKMRQYNDVIMALHLTKLYAHKSTEVHE
jgi:hypothetical protein